MSVRLPAAVSSAPPAILIVEDDPETRLFYSAAFEGHGFVIEQAHNGFQALEKALKTPPDLIVTDIAVPGIDGIELCRRLRADERHPRDSGSRDHRLRRSALPDRARLAGADHVLTKPCDPELLVTEARRLLAQTTA